MNHDPRIGKLNSGKFYCFQDGHGKPEFIGSLEEVEVALGLRQPIARESKPAKKQGELRDYIVTITPRRITYAGCATFGEYAVEVVARSNNDAITTARRERNESEGRYGVPATYRARLAVSCDETRIVKE